METAALEGIYIDLKGFRASTKSGGTPGSSGHPASEHRPVCPVPACLPPAVPGTCRAHHPHCVRGNNSRPFSASAKPRLLKITACNGSGPGLELADHADRGFRSPTKRYGQARDHLHHARGSAAPDAGHRGTPVRPIICPPGYVLARPWPPECSRTGHEIVLSRVFGRAAWQPLALAFPGHKLG